MQVLEPTELIARGDRIYQPCRRYRRSMSRRALLILALLALVAGCTRAGGEEVALERAAPPETTTTVVDATTTTTASTTTAPAPPSTTTTVRRTRIVRQQAWVPFATVEGVVLHHPSTRVERVGFHESNHDGARPLSPLPTAVDPLVLETRERGNPPTTAADVVVDPDVEIRAPVTGVVKRAGSYVLYCDHSDDFAVIEPDTRPGWEVKILHIDGVLVRRGDRVVGGETVVAPRPTRLPFESQIDEVTADPAWPHVHIEVVDPSIPDRPGQGC